MLCHVSRYSMYFFCLPPFTYCNYNYTILCLLATYGTQIGDKIPAIISYFNALHE